MKNFSNYPIILLLAALLFIVSCGDSKLKTTLENERSNQMKILQLSRDSLEMYKHIFDAPVHDAEVLIKSRDSLQWKVKSNSDSSSIIFNKSKINLVEFIAFYKLVHKNKLSNYIRVYFAHKSGTDNLSFIITNTDEKDSSKDLDYYFLSQDYYDGVINKFNASCIIESSLAKQYVKSYKDSVTINGIAQIERSDSNSFKLSRSFKWVSFLNLFSANIPGFDLDDIQTYKEYSIEFDFAFINRKEDFILTQRYGKDYLPFIGYRGVTSIMSLYRGSTHLVDPKLEDGSSNYKLAYLEVGHPCPPQCGSINWSNIDK